MNIEPIYRVAKKTVSVVAVGALFGSVVYLMADDALSRGGGSGLQIPSSLGGFAELFDTKEKPTLASHSEVTSLGPDCEALRRCLPLTTGLNRVPVQPSRFTNDPEINAVNRNPKRPSIQTPPQGRTSKSEKPATSWKNNKKWIEAARKSNPFLSTVGATPSPTLPRKVMGIGTKTDLQGAQPSLPTRNQPFTGLDKPEEISGDNISPECSNPATDQGIENPMAELSTPPLPSYIPANENQVSSCPSWCQQ